MKKLLIDDQSGSDYMNVKTISTYLGLAKSTIYKWVESGFIPHRKLGKHVLFIKKEIDEWVYNDRTMVSDLPELSNAIKNNFNGKIQLRA